MANDISVGISGFITMSEEYNKISRVCNEISISMNKRQPIHDRLLHNLSRLTCFFISSGISESFPEDFFALSDSAEDYWLYSAKKEKNKDICFTYVRVYQITNMAKTWMGENKRNILLSSAIENNRKHYDLISTVYSFPGINHKTLSNELGITASMLSHRTKVLEDQHILFSKREGKNKYYSLSNLGLSLYKKLNESNRANSLWSSQRLQLISKILNYVALSNVSVKHDRIIKLLILLNQYDDITLANELKSFVDRNTRGYYNDEQMILQEQNDNFGDARYNTLRSNAEQTYPMNIQYYVPNTLYPLAEPIGLLK